MQLYKVGRRQKLIKMSFLGKEYKCYKQENFDGFLRFAGIPEENIEATSSFLPTQKLVQNGDSYTSYSSYPDGSSSETVFKSGVEVDELIGPQKRAVKTTYVVDGNTVTQTVKSDKGDAYFKKEYNGDDLLVTITATGWDGEAKRYYKAN